jgi:SDR family mycofactocin-dependent oxidoreductase
MGRFNGQVAMITGAARGQGRSHAVRFAQEGADVVVLDIPGARLATVPYPLPGADDLAETVALVEAAGGRAVACVADVRDAAAVDAAVAAGLEAFGRIDVLAANAGICTFHPIDGMPAEVWQEMIDINLTGVFNAVRAVTGHMIERGSGRIVATSSMAGRAGWENLSHYAAAKWGLIGFVKSVAAELAPHGITANIVCPSSVNTTMMHNDASYRLFRPDLEHPTRDDALPAFASVNVIPVPYVESDDVSDSVLFLASDEARYVTGATLSPSAGVNARNI